MDFEKLLKELRDAERMISYHTHKRNFAKAYAWKMRAAITIADVKQFISFM